MNGCGRDAVKSPCLFSKIILVAFMKTLLLSFWQFPQILLGGLISLWYRNRWEATGKYKGVRYMVIPDMRGGGLSLGDMIFVKKYLAEDKKLYDHEWGHTRQSLYLGWLYLPIIGLPSLVWAMIHKDEWAMRYHDFYTEKWADKLGGVER